MAVKIRIANRLDTASVLSLGLRMHEEAPSYRGVPFDDRRTAESILRMIEGSDADLFLAEQDGQLIGFAGVIEQGYFFSNASYAMEMTVYVHPDHRKRSRAGYLLIKALEAWAQARGLTRLVVGVSTGIENNSAVELYERMGYSKTSTSLEKVFNDV